MRVASLWLALALGACAHTIPNDQNARQGDVIEGRRLAEINCARCHAIGRDGSSTHPLAPPFRELSRAYPVNALEEAFAEGVLVGHPVMPEFRLEPEQIDDLLAYIESVQDRRAG